MKKVIKKTESHASNKMYSSMVQAGPSMGQKAKASLNKKKK